jgi:hypothetical protein
MTITERIYEVALTALTAATAALYLSAPFAVIFAYIGFQRLTENWPL